MLSQEERKILKDTLVKSVQDLDLSQLCKECKAQNLEETYSKAYYYYQIGKYSKAKKLFLRLVMLQPLQKKYWMGLAACRQLEKNYKEALVAWSMVALFDDKDPLPHFHAAECCYMLEQKEEGLKALHASRERVDEQHLLIIKMQTLQENLENGKCSSY